LSWFLLRQSPQFDRSFREPAVIFDPPFGSSHRQIRHPARSATTMFFPHFVGDACSPTSAKGAIIDHEPHRFLQGGKVGKQWTNVLKPS
jgi:predicted RNA methylase